MEVVGNLSFTFTTGNGKRSRLRRLMNGVPQGSVLVPLLFNIYISDLPGTVSRKYAYADDLAIMHGGGDWQAAEGAWSPSPGALVHSTAENSAPVWCHIARTRLIDPAINDALRIVTGCLRPTPADSIPILAGIQPGELRRSGVSGTPFHEAWTSAPLSAHPSIECKRTARQIETPICNRRTTSHPFI